MCNSIKFTHVGKRREKKRKLAYNFKNTDRESKEGESMRIVYIPVICQKYYSDSDCSSN